MRIGYACKTLAVPDTEQKSCTAANASEQNLLALIGHNLDALAHAVDYNARNGIQLYRISSDLIPFGSSPVNPLPWWEIYAEKLAGIGAAIRTAGMRVSMHPGQYTVLNSPSVDVVRRAVKDLEYHARVLDALGTDAGSKIILHVGGVYGNRAAALERFPAVYADLSEAVKRRLVLENDDKSYPIGEVLELGTRLGIPVVYDTLHNRVNPCNETKGDAYWIAECARTWRPADGPQKIHYSQQDPDKAPGSHSRSIAVEEFLRFLAEIVPQDVDVMLEVKDKNLSAVKCVNCIATPGHIDALEREWGRYKYAVLEHSPDIYQQARALLRDKAAYPAREFYALMERAMREETNPGRFRNAAEHVWGYFKGKATTRERAAYERASGAVDGSEKSMAAIKKVLWKLAQTYGEDYLLNSYYFVL